MQPLADGGAYLRRAVDYMERARRAMEDPPLVYAPQEVADRWVLVPREHLRRAQMWGDAVTGEAAIEFATDVLADARLLGVTPPVVSDAG